MSKAFHTMVTIALLGSGAPAQAEEQRFGLYELERAAIGDGGPYYDTSLSPHAAGPAGRPAESAQDSSAPPTEASPSDKVGPESSDD